MAFSKRTLFPYKSWSLQKPTLFVDVFFACVALKVDRDDGGPFSIYWKPGSQSNFSQGQNKSKILDISMLIKLELVTFIKVVIEQNDPKLFKITNAHSIVITTNGPWC